MAYREDTFAGHGHAFAGLAAREENQVRLGAEGLDVPETEATVVPRSRRDENAALT